MGKYMRKAKMTGEVAVMEVSQSSLGVRTRARTLAMQKPAVNPTTVASSCYLQLRSRRLLKQVVPHEAKKTKEPGCKEKANPIPRLVSASLNSGSVRPVSLGCPKKNGDADVVEGPLSTVPPVEGSPENEVGLEASFGENILDTEGRERRFRETTPSSLIRASENPGTPSSTTRPTTLSASQHRIHGTMCRNIPTTNEMEEFFADAELQQQRIFTQKYNYDPVNDLPLPGRYEWAPLDG
ncbi:cyclin-dependent kinase inhibitor 5-like [Aristolochia californica]|uniref:cyclin-dependent kinase inhibitor 5-like n=1 Tax=Aristolochia californica TaxID=171875 RepID=UPI0035DDCB64